MSTSTSYGSTKMPEPIKDWSNQRQIKNKIKLT